MTTKSEAEAVAGEHLKKTMGGHTSFKITKASYDIFHYDVYAKVYNPDGTTDKVKVIVKDGVAKKVETLKRDI